MKLMFDHTKRSDTERIHERIAAEVRSSNDPFRIIAERWGCSISSIAKIAAKYGIRRGRRIASPLTRTK